MIRKNHCSASGWAILLSVDPRAYCSIAKCQVSGELVREGQSALDAGDFTRAVQEFEQAQQVSPENLESESADWR